MRKLLFIFAALLLSSIGLHAQTFTVGNFRYTITHEPDPFSLFDVGTVSVGLVQYDGYAGSFVISGSAYYEQKDKWYSITAIDNNGFMRYATVTGVTVGSPVTWIGYRAFYECTGLTFATMDNTVEMIGSSAFAGCTKLNTVTLCSSVKVIEANTFENCTSLKTVYCYALTPPKLDTDVFKNVPQDISIYTFNTEAYQSAWGSQLPASCFKPITAEVGDFKYEFFEGNKARVVAKDGGYTQSSIIIPEQVTYQGLTFTVTGIGQSAFQDCTGLTSITIPTLIKEIKDHAFKNCTNLKDLQFADRTDAIRIGAYAFENMSLEEVIIPDWMTEIPEGLFYNNPKLEIVYLPERVNKIGYRPFGLCPLEYIISMGQTPPALVDGAFQGHDKDDKVIVYVPTSDAVSAYKNSDWGKYFTNIITELEYRIISSADRTAELVKAIPVEGKVYVPPVVTLEGNQYNVAGIGNDAFNYSDKDNEDLQSISLPPTMRYIGDRAFNRCVKLTQIELPIELQAIGASAFYGCSALDSIVIPEGVQTIGKSAFMDCSKLTSISLPAGLKNIPDECFRRCPLGQEIVVPEGVETIGEYAFEGTAEAAMDAEHLTLPSTLKELNLGAFFFHDGLKDVTCLATTPPTLKGQAFAEYQYQKYKDEHITVYVPNRDVMAKYRDDKNQWGSDLYKFKFTDLMAEANKQYLRTLAGSNDTAKAIANAYCDSIDNRATTTQQVQDYTNTAAMLMDKYVLPDYKERLCNKLDTIAATVLNAQSIADDYKQRIMDTHFRGEAENLFVEGCAKIDALKQLYDLKATYGKALQDMARGYKGAEDMANIYAGLIDGAATQAEVYQLYEEGKKRVAKALFIDEYWTESDGCYVLGGFIEE
ncbi:MAG: leucine-rich repeat domain-containing protein [Paludibacteraceae bacterium]|nr:leucine-rich repeat domain-containing protein [Paludibacteraceae bacterium]